MSDPIASSDEREASAHAVVDEWIKVNPAWTQRECRPVDILSMARDAVRVLTTRRQGLVSVSREQVDRAALDAARAVRGVAAHLRDADRLHVTAALHSLGITVAD